MKHDSDRREAALDWLVRTNDPEFDGWRRFHRLARGKPGQCRRLSPLAGGEADVAARSCAGCSCAREAESGAAAPGTAVAVPRFSPLVTALVAPRMMPIDYSTGPGEVRIVSLGGRDQLVMNGDTRCAGCWDRRASGSNRASCWPGQPDGGRVEVISGDLELVDVGTVFEVSRDGRETRVLVSDGVIVADPDGAGLWRPASGSTPKMAPTAAGDGGRCFIGRILERGQLSYLDEPLDHVVADLRRSTGIDFSASAAISTRRFTGTLSVAEVKRDPRSLAPLLGVSMERSGQGWKLGGKV